MNPLWLSQLGAVMRLELRKSFFNRRSFWIYLMALAPVLIFAGHAWEESDDRARMRSRAEARPGVTQEKVARIREEMPESEVIAILGEPPHRYSRGGRTRREVFEYSDGKSEFDIVLREGVVQRVATREGCDLGKDTLIFAGVFQFLFLRLLVFFGCVFVFINLFRGEMLDKSLHYYFLAPVRREIVVAGKFLAGLVATSVIFGGSVLLQLVILDLHFPAQVLEEYLTRGNGWQHAIGYVGVTALACLGYGSVFLTGGMLLRNPLIPAAVILVWESINGLLPSVLRKLSVIFYLRSLSPVEVPIDRGVPPPLALLAMNVEPVAPIVAVLGLMALSAGLLVLAARRSRHLEIQYGSE